jgi:lipopolysaccharide transport system permease protein
LAHIEPDRERGKGLHFPAVPGNGDRRQPARGRPPGRAVASRNRSARRAKVMAETRKLIIEAGKTEGHYWRDLWRYRELFYFLAWRDILVRYKQTAVGIAWALIRPFLTIAVFTVVFGKLAKLPTEVDAPYAIMVCAAMLPWQFFATSLSEASASLVGNANLISKVYFPRLIIPASSVITSLIDLLLSTVILAGLMLWYQFAPTWRVLTLPLFAAIALAASLGAGLWLTALNVKYRDFRYVIPFIVQVGLYLSPVGFSSSIVPERWRLLYSLNPMVGVIDGFRWAILGGDAQVYLPGFFLSLAVVGMLLLFGTIYFRKTERKFADII